MKLRALLIATAACLFAANIAVAQDPAKVDPKHYKIEFENDKVRILRIHYGPHDTSVMHSHPAGVVVYLSDGSIRFNLPDGKTVDATGKKGQALYSPAIVHNPENPGGTDFDAVLIEMK